MKGKLIVSGVLILSSFLLLGSTAAASGTWYVDGVRGSDNNDCKSPQTACKTIGHAILLASSADTILVAPATHAENLAIPFSLTINGAKADTTIVDGGKRKNVIIIPNHNSTVTLSDITIQNGQAADGGGIYNSYNSTLTIDNSMIIGNTATHGGGIANAGTLTVRYSTFRRNSACYGGAIESAGGMLTINNSTISENKAGCSKQGEGGGILMNGGAATIINSTISGNTAQYSCGSLCVGGNGGGIANYSGTLTISNGTLGGNFAVYYGGGIYNHGGTTTLQDSIAANSPSGGNCYVSGGTVLSNGYNLSSDGTCPFNNVGDLNNTDPKLGPLQNNGGPTWTHALLTGSPAIDAGNPAHPDGQGNDCLPTDQRGVYRTARSDRCDMGAYEYP